MIRLAHTSDLHIDERGRLEDVMAVLDAFLEQAEAAEVDLIVVAGDHFERRSTPAERNVLAGFLQNASAIAPVACVKGNHDAEEDLAIFNRLEVVNSVQVFDRPTAAPGSAATWIVGRGRHVGILALPWFDKAHLVAGLDATVDADETRERTIAAARDLLTCLRAEASRLRSEGVVPILIGHLLVGGSEVSTGQTLIGTTVELAPADLADVGAAYVALGHVHMTQEWAGGRVAYSGSPHRCNFGEGREAKGWRLVTLSDEGEFLRNEFRELPARPMVLLEADWTDGTEEQLSRQGGIDPNCFALMERDWVAGALVRFRYRIRAQDLHLVDEAVIRKVFEADGAADVQIEAVVEAQVRVRSEEIVRAQTLYEKLDAYLASKGMNVDTPTRARLHAKVGLLEAA
jgi:exonuclease SbcD